jgi:hypothetical protein
MTCDYSKIDTDRLLDAAQVQQQEFSLVDFGGCSWLVGTATVIRVLLLMLLRCSSRNVSRGSPSHAEKLQQQQQQ